MFPYSLKALKIVGNEISPIIHLRMQASGGSPVDDEKQLEKIVAAVSHLF